jgi:hypothetical protein
LNFDDNFRRIGGANIEPIKALITELDSEQWENEAHYKAHRDTQSILLVHDSDFRHTNPTRHPALQNFGSVIRPILAIAADFYDESTKGRVLTEKFGTGYFIRANLTQLLPGATIADHRDMNFSFTHSHRVHVPIITNDQVRITVGGETLSIPEGEIYEINNRRVHSVCNTGDEPRVHLILDYVLQGEMCCCGEKRHPGQPCTPESCLDTVTGQISCTCQES